jgi:dihydropteroate synthase
MTAPLTLYDVWRMGADAAWTIVNDVRAPDRSTALAAVVERYGARGVTVTERAAYMREWFETQRKALQAQREAK